MYRRMALFIGGTALALSVLVLNCTNSPWTPESQIQGEGIALFKIGVTRNSTFTTLASEALLTVSAPDMVKMTHSLLISDSSVKGLSRISRRAHIVYSRFSCMIHRKSFNITDPHMLM